MASTSTPAGAKPASDQPEEGVSFYSYTDHQLISAAGLQLLP